MSAEVWRYDGSVWALAALALRSYEEGRAPELVFNAARADSEAELWSDPEAAGEAPLAPSGPSSGGEQEGQRLLSLSPRLYAATLRAWMSEEGVEAELLELAADFRARGEPAFSDYTRPSLRLLAGALHRVIREVDRLEGFARFSPRFDPLIEEERFVALLEPDLNVLPAMGPFFLRRFRSTPFALVDLKRGYGLASRSGGLEFRGVEELAALEPDGSDAEETRLWQRYFKATENPSRKNPRLQRALMPRRYWAHLVEMGPMRSYPTKNLTTESTEKAAK
jgi:probable DNA metabolism protein